MMGVRGSDDVVPISPFLCEPGDDGEWEGEHDDVAVLRDVVQGLQEPQLEIVRQNEAS